VVTETRQGYGFALRRGLEEARGDIIILAEPDGTFVGRDVLKLLAYADDFDMVCGTRTTRELIWDQANMGWFLRVGNWSVAKLLQVLHGGPSLSDCGCTLRLTHRGAVERFRVSQVSGYWFDLQRVHPASRPHQRAHCEPPFQENARNVPSQEPGSPSDQHRFHDWCCGSGNLVCRAGGLAGEWRSPASAASMSTS